MENTQFGQDGPSVQNIQLYRQSLKFLTVFIKSDVFLEMVSSVEDNNRNIIAKRSFQSIERNIQDLEKKLDFVKLISSCIHDDKGVIFNLLMRSQNSAQALEDYDLQEERNRMITSLSKFLSESISFFRCKCENQIH